LAFPHKVNSH